ncbi:bifunctional folylpolyglutamate synthase/dihydrofolate synthase [Bacillus fonticola]|uniref:bifunctional folylpolyglutamate synthase/dihydrofolate synthase n=1 Tax=Bacillus fonticola TaxID=2728853 RepID=UPI00147664B8|nr:folylpolyglutamate synthase/dihydrofolate synthase family protein [Bacillus fonticola]
MKTVDEAIGWLHNRLRLGIKPGLERMEWLMNYFENPEKRLRAVHIGGTNGKGSTVTMMREALQASGYRVGTFTSPYIERFQERISTNGTPISDEALFTLVQEVKEASEQLEQTTLGAPSEFECITAIAFRYFTNVDPVDIVLFEVGLGGRLDSTNVVAPIVTGITNVGFDHMAFLGNTIKEIAFEKAGIMKSGVPVMTTETKPEVVTLFAEHAKSVGTDCEQIGTEFSATYQESTEIGERFFYQDQSWSFAVETSLKGRHQVSNGALAIRLLHECAKRGFDALTPEAIQIGLKRSRWPGRFEIIRHHPTIIFDGAHNEEGVAALTNTMATRLAGTRVTVLFSALVDKPFVNMTSQLQEHSDRLVWTTFPFPRSATKETVKNVSKSVEWAENAVQWIEDWYAEADADEVLVVTGSLYFISYCRQALI